MINRPRLSLNWYPLRKNSKAVELLSNVSKTLRDIDLDSDIDQILDRINLAASRPSSPVNNSTFEQLSAFSRSSASPMKSPLKSANGLYSPGSPNMMKMNASNLFRSNVGQGNGMSPFKGSSMLKMKDDPFEEKDTRGRGNLRMSGGRRSQSTMR